MALLCESQGRFLLIAIWFTSSYAGHNQASLGDLAKVFSLLAGGGNCRLICPSGASPKKNPRHKPSSNGCGSQGIKLDVSELPGFKECCNNHDICYDTCNSDRATCDDEFKSCLTDACLSEELTKKRSKGKLEDCRSVADLMHSGTVGLGCTSFMESQRNACLCDGRKLSLAEMKRMEEGTEL